MENVEDIDASCFRPLLNRVLNLTDQAWRADNAGQPFEFSRVEQEFEWLLDEVDRTQISLGEETMTLEQFATIMSKLAHARSYGKRTSSTKAFQMLVEAVGPISDKSKVISTAKRY